ncbi:MAG TPA: MauE/DoxX family redox-associated membrane protein [Pyrinomonadaceae bacterium]|nr:MauE/DoxX family redox-associated membrane protein [Pyrinomonadaceae bacterium]
MLITLLALRLGLAAVFGVAGVAKLLDQRGTRDAVTNFGAPASWSAPVALLLPFVEITIAYGLLLSFSAWASALTAVLLLGFFITAIAINLGRGRAPECHCFGQLYARPLGRPTLVRNMVFALAAGFVVWEGQPVNQASTLLLSENFGEGLYVPLIAPLAMAFVVATIVYFQRARAKGGNAGPIDNHRSPDLHGLPLGSLAPVFQLPAYRRDQTSLAELLEARKPVLLIFSNPNCGPCAGLFAELAQWQQTYPEQVTIAVLTQGTLKDNFVNIARNDLRNILFQKQREIAEQYQCLATPTGILVSPDGRIASTPAAGADKIRSLIHSTLENHSRPLDSAEAQIPNANSLPQPSTQNAD